MLTQAEEGEVVFGVLVLHSGSLHGLAYDVVHHLDGAPLPKDDLLHCCSVWNPCSCQQPMNTARTLVVWGRAGTGGREGGVGVWKRGGGEKSNVWAPSGEA